MYCPKCSQSYESKETQFCSRCGVQLIATTETTATVREKTKLSPRQKGIRQGIVLMALSVILIPAYFLLAALFPANDRLVESAVSDTPFEKISQAILLTLFLAGLARLLYARFFQTGETPQPDAAQLDERSSLKYALPAAQATPVPGFGGWRVNTDELVGTASVTEHTTKSLDEK